jgi:hypothetical protein
VKTFGCFLGADVFAHLFELVIEKDILKLDDRSTTMSTTCVAYLTPQYRTCEKVLTGFHSHLAARPILLTGARNGFI